jgi:hypothetical protein
MTKIIDLDSIKYNYTDEKDIDEVLRELFEVVNTYISETIKTSNNIELILHSPLLSFNNFKLK